MGRSMRTGGGGVALRGGGAYWGCEGTRATGAARCGTCTRGG